MRIFITLLSIFVFSFFIVILGCFGIPQAWTQQEPQQETLANAISAAIEAQNEEQLRSLVEENRFKVYSLVCELLDESITEDLEGNGVSAQEKQRKAETLAEQYKAIFTEDYLIDRIKLYQEWSREEKEKKVEADGLMKEGLSARGKSEFQSALEKFSTALQSYTSIADTIGEGQALNNIGTIFFYFGDYQKAEDFFERSLKVFKEIGHRMGEGKALNSIGIVRFSTGQFRKAEDYYRQYLNICREAGNRKDEGKASNNIGLIYSNLGQYREAIEYYKRALRIRKEIGDKRGEGFSFQSIAGIYNALGQYQRAIEYQEQALNIFIEIEDRRRHGVALNNMGDIYLYMGQYEKALEYLKDALTLGREVGNKEGEEISMNSIGYIYRILGQHELAIEYLEQSLHMCREIGDLRGEGFNLIDLGSVYMDVSRYQPALEHCMRGLEIALSIGAPQVIWPAQMRIGSIYEGLGRIDEALDYYARSIATVESMREELDVGSLKTHFLSNKLPTYYSMVNLLTWEKRYEEAYNYTERAKARALLDLLSLGRIDITEGISPELLKTKKDVEKRLNEIQQQLSAEYSTSESEQDPARVATLEKDLSALRSEHEEILRTVELNHPQYATLTGVKEPLTLDDVQERVLDDGIVLIEYLVGEEHTVVWVVGKHSLHFEEIDIRRTELDSMVRKWRQPFKDIKEGRIDNLADVGFDMELSHELYVRIFHPLEQYLDSGDALMIVPDGILHYLPFEALVVALDGKDYDRKTVFSEYEGVEFLVEKYPVAYSPSASILDPNLKRPQVEMERQDKLIAFGNPDFGSDRDQGERAGKDDYLSLLIRDSKGWVFSPLPRSEEEVHEITRIMNPSQKFLKGQAKEEFFKQDAGEFEIIHLATHGILEEKQPLYSRIVLAQDDDPAEDGFLQTFEIFNMDLKADLVVLSACETGLGEFSAGEGLIGLTRAFMYAGAPSVIVSLWSVDESTCRLMRAFYKNLKKGMTKTEALREAKIKLIHTRDGGMSYAHPFLWAPFVLVGDWK